MNKSTAYIVRFTNDQKQCATFTPTKDRALIKRSKDILAKDHEKDEAGTLNPKDIFWLFNFDSKGKDTEKLFILFNPQEKPVAALLANIESTLQKTTITLNRSYVLKDFRGKSVMSYLGAEIRKKLFDEHDEKTYLKCLVLPSNTASQKLQKKFGAQENNNEFSLNRKDFEKAMPPEKIQAELEKLRANCPELFPVSEPTALQKRKFLWKCCITLSNSL